MIHKLKRVVLFCFLGSILFGRLQQIITPNFSDYGTDRVISGVKYLDADEVDVVFIGDSTEAFGIAPIELYKNTGICSYTLGTSRQPFEMSYYLMRDVFSRWSPAVIVVNASGLIQDDSNNDLGWRYVLENYPNNSIKVAMAKTYDEQGYDGGFLSVFFPIIKYHSRWTELSDKDFLLKGRKEYYSLGQWITGGTYGVGDITEEEVNTVAAHMLEGSRTIRYNGTAVTTETIEEPLYDPIVSDEMLDYLMKMKKLCDENSAQLVLVKIPQLCYPQNRSAWTEQKSNAVKQICEKYSVPFWDIMYDINTGIDWKSDTYDAGKHMNFRGAQKITNVLGQYLTDSFSLCRQSSPQYDAYVERYDKIAEVAMLQSETDYDTYIQRLKDNAEHWAVFIAASDEYTAGLDEKSYGMLEELGLQLIQQGNYRDAYAAVIDRGTLKYEVVSGRKINETVNLSNLSVCIKSSGWYTDPSPSCSISINGVDYAISGRGLCFVVYDYESNMVIDSVLFDTCNPTKTHARNWIAVNKYLRTYEAKMCFGETGM